MRKILLCLAVFILILMGCSSEKSRPKKVSIGIYGPRVAHVHRRRVHRRHHHRHFHRRNHSIRWYRPRATRRPYRYPLYGRSRRFYRGGRCPHTGR